MPRTLFENSVRQRVHRMGSLRVVGMAALACGPRSPAAAETLSVPSDYPTIADALEVAQPGDVISIGAGEYGESVTPFVDGLTIRGEGADLTTLRGDGEPVFELSYAADVTIEDLAIESAGIGVNMYGTHGITIRHTKIRAQYGVASGDCYDLWLQGNLFEGGDFGYYSYRDWARDPAGTSDFVIEENRFVGNWVAVFIDSSLAMTVRRNTFFEPLNIGLVINSWGPHQIYENLFDGGPGGILFVEYDDEVWPPDLSSGLPSEGTASKRPRVFERANRLRAKATSATDVTVYNNVFYRTGVVGIYGYGLPYNPERFWVRNNIFYQNTGMAVYGMEGGAADGATWNERMPIGYNTFYGNGSDFGGAIESRGRRVQGRNLFSDPRFTDATAGDFSLQSGSRSINTGTLDIDGDGNDDLETWLGAGRDRGIEDR